MVIGEICLCAGSAARFWPIACEPSLDHHAAEHIIINAGKTSGEKRMHARSINSKLN